MWATKQNNQQNKKEVEALHLLKHSFVRMTPVSVPLARGLTAFNEAEA